MTPDTSLPNPPLFLRCLRWLILAFPRGRHLMIRWITPFVVDRPPFRAKFDGGSQAFVADLRNRVARSLFFYGFYENVQTAVLLRMLQPGQVVIDAGANIGYFTLLASARVGAKGRVIAFEPEPGIAALLRQNVALNGHVHVVVEEAAVGRTKGCIAFSAGDPEQWGGDTGTTVVDESAPHKNLINVRVVTLDAYCREHGIDRVDVLKMDIEGGEGDALEGMRQGIQQGMYRRVFLELHPQLLRKKGQTAEGILAAFIGHGYSCWRLLNHPPGLLGHYSIRFRDDLLAPYDGTTVDEYWPHFLLLAKGDSITARQGEPA